MHLQEPFQHKNIEMHFCSVSYFELLQYSLVFVTKNPQSSLVTINALFIPHCSGRNMRCVLESNENSPGLQGA